MKSAAIFQSIPNKGITKKNKEKLTTIFIWAWLDSNTMVGTFVPHQVLAATEKETWKKKLFHIS